MKLSTAHSRTPITKFFIIFYAEPVRIYLILLHSYHCDTLCWYKIKLNLDFPKWENLACEKDSF